ncbi:Zn-ribbon domain-containing OB-fold protein [Sinimarinibacterium thermocellulolyticum]|uniref:OB-fold domain-containing protein n=1 Tax=Sinimarinibacterium thermocellulolyticum TaxID=3170016 RepID=A0ABV2ABQ8_9GAMM
MSAPVLEGWFTLDAEPRLIGNRCRRCGTYYFPRLKTGFCRNPDCDGESFEDTPLSRTGRLWSYTNAAYAPPEPYVACEPFQPFGIAAVELEQERMIVLGQLVRGTELSRLALGMPMVLVLEALDDGKLTWKWKVAT